MRESFAFTAWKGLSEQARRFVQWLCFGRSGFWIAAFVVALVGWRSLSIWSSHSHHRKIAEAFGSVGYLYGTPQANQSGDQITFIQTTTNGIGVFLCDIATGQKKLVYEQPAKQKDHNQIFDVWPWSPDDRLFLYTSYSIHVCQGETGDEVAETSYGNNGNEGVRGLAWLTSDKFVYFSLAGNVFMVSRQKDNKWQSAQLDGVKINADCPFSGISETPFFAALSCNAVTWKQDNSIWILNLDSKTVTKIYQPREGQTLDSVDYSKDNGSFLLKIRSLPNFSGDEIKDMSKFVSRLAQHPDPISDLLWQSLSEPQQLLLKNYQPSASDSTQVRDILVQALNQQVWAYCIYDSKRFKDIPLRTATRDLLKQIKMLPNTAVLDRLLLEDAFPLELSRNPLKETDDASLWKMRPNDRPEQIAFCPQYTTTINWLDPTNGSCAYLCSKTDNTIKRALTLQSGSPAESSTLFAHGIAETLTVLPSAGKLFVVGIVSNEPAESIWQYDVSSKKLQCVVPCTDHPYPYARHVEALHDTLKLASGQTADYYLYSPVNFNPRQHKKYPLVIGDSMCKPPDSEHQRHPNVPLWAEAVACCDAYVVIVNRPNWESGLDQWKENVMEAYKHLVPSLPIDTNQVFLFCVSGESGWLCDLVQEQPELWKGLLLVNPGALPRLSELPPGKSAPKILINAGQAEGRDDEFKRYQIDAAQKGVPLEVVIDPNSTHFMINITALRDRTKAIVNLIFDN